MRFDTHIIVFWYANKIGTGVSCVDQDLVQLANKNVPKDAPYFIVEKSLQETLPDKNWQNVQLDWSNPDGYGERVIPTPEE
jgi:hypothetical protein